MSERPVVAEAEASDVSAPSKPPSIGHAVEGPGYYVWDTVRSEARSWAALLEAVHPAGGSPPSR
jgi:hypothetical protein